MRKYEYLVRVAMCHPNSDNNIEINYIRSFSSKKEAFQYLLSISADHPGFADEDTMTAILLDTYQLISMKRLPKGV